MNLLSMLWLDQWTYNQKVVGVTINRIQINSYIYFTGVLLKLFTFGLDNYLLFHRYICISVHLVRRKQQ